MFIDIVGYSKLLIDEERERIRELKEIVRGTEQFRLAEAQAKLLRLPTGDSGALVFRTSPVFTCGLWIIPWIVISIEAGTRPSRL